MADEARRGACCVLVACMGCGQVRTRPTLVKVVSHLLHNVARLGSVPYPQRYGFISDRLRSVRQELTVQGCRGDDVIRMYECMTRFHVASVYRTAQTPHEDVSPVLNEKSLTGCLTALLEMYAEKRAALGTAGPVSPCEAEMWSYAVLQHAASEDLAYVPPPPAALAQLHWVVL